MKFRDIPQFPSAGYTIDIEWGYVEKYVSDADLSLIMEPDYQRGHVWSDAQRIAFVEYGLMGGESSMVITTNCPGWMGDWRGPFELVDGLQRLTAVLKFMRNELPAFGHYRREYTDNMRGSCCRFKWRVLNLPTRAEVLNLYLLMNSGGVVHSPEEITRVRGLLEEAKR